MGRLAAGGVWGSLLESYQFGAPARSIIGQLKSRAFGGPRGPRGLLKNASIRIRILTVLMNIWGRGDKDQGERRVDKVIKGLLSYGVQQPSLGEREFRNSRKMKNYRPSLEEERDIDFTSRTSTTS